MADKLSLQRLAASFRILGWVGFWSQLTLGVVCFGVLTFQNLGRAFSREKIVGLGPGLSITTLAFLVLIYSIWHYFNYVKLGRQLGGDPQFRPSRQQTQTQLERGIWVNCVGLALAVFGYQALAGSLTFQASMVQPGFTGLNNPMGNNAITSLEMFSLLSNTQALTGHVIGLLLGLWLLRSVQAMARNR